MAAIAPIDRSAPPLVLNWLSDRCDLPDLLGRLSRGEISAYHVIGTQAAIILSIATARDSGAKGMWIESLGGTVGGSAKANRRLLGSVLRDCEMLARASHCSEIRIEAGNRTALKHRLFVAFGFEIYPVENTTVMRKAL